MIVSLTYDKNMTAKKVNKTVLSHTKGFMYPSNLCKGNISGNML